MENSKTYHFQLKSLKNTQYLGQGKHFCDLGKTGLKTQKFSFCQFKSVQMKHNFKNLKEVFVKNISVFNPMVFISTYDNCKDGGVIFFEFIQDTWIFSHSCSIWLLGIHSLHFYAYGLNFIPSFHKSKKRFKLHLS